MTLNVERLSTQPAPARSSAAIVSSRCVLTPTIAAASARAQPAQRTMASVDSSPAQARGSERAGHRTDTERAEQQAVRQRSTVDEIFATSGSSARIELAPKPKTALRTRTVRMTGDIAT